MIDTIKFYPNFNSHTADNVVDVDEVTRIPTKKLVYISSDLFHQFIDLKFKNFEFPKFEPNRIFISIVNRLSKTNTRVYLVNAIYYRTAKDVRTFNLFNNDKMILNKKPFEIHDNTKDKAWEFKKTTTTINFENLPCNYLNYSEIVYSLDIKDFNKCHPNFAKNTKNKEFENIEINCSALKETFKGLESVKSVTSSDDLPDGLKRVYNQLQEENKIII